MLRGSPGLRVEGVSIDSRTIEPGQLFLALRGDKYDGFDFIGEALARGASVVMSERDPLPGTWPEAAGRALIRVGDSNNALCDLARGYRSQLKPAVVAITGSNGKTTTKELVGMLLGKKLKTVVAPASYNNRIGVSLTVLRINQDDRAAVFELGMNHRGEIKELGEICRPGMGVVLNVGSAHIGFLGSLEEIASEKAGLLDTLEGEKIAVLNNDDERVKKMREKAPGRVIGFGLRAGAEVRAQNPNFSAGGVEFELSYFSRRCAMVSPLPGRHNLYNLLAALAVAGHFGLTLAEMKEGVSRVALPPMRMEEVRIRGATVINDAYNANPVSMRSALSAWRLMPVSGRRILVSGDMNELGDFAPREHRIWGKELGRSGLDCLVFVGPLSAEAARSAAEEGFPRENIFASDRIGPAAEYINKIMESGDSVLLKGSRVMELERIIEVISRQ